MQTYRRFASTASSTSRSASTSMHHGHPHGLSRSSSTTGTTTNDTSNSTSRGLSIVMPAPGGIARGLASPSNTAPWSPNTQYGTLSSSNLNLSPEPYNRDPHAHGQGQTDLHTIAESLLAHVTFGPYHIASSPVPSSHMHTLLAASQSSSRNKENLTASSTSLSSLASSSTTSLYPSSYAPSSVLGPSARRQFEGKEGSHHHSHSHSSSAHGSHGGQHRLATVNYPLPPLSQLSSNTAQLSNTQPSSNTAQLSSSSAATPHSPTTPSTSHTPRSNHPRARFTIGPQEERGRAGARAGAGRAGGRGSRGGEVRGLGGEGRGLGEGRVVRGEEGTRGRGLGRKSVGGIGLSVRDSSSNELWELDEDEDGERGRGARGRRGDVKVLQQ